jgi:hypothetical protein
MPNVRARAPMRRFARTRRMAGWGLTIAAVLLVPICWVTAAVLHASSCGVGLTAWTCTETVGTFVVHQTLVSLSPAAAVLLFAVGDALRHAR